MSEETEYIAGLRAFPKHQNAPDFVLCDLSLEREVLHKWLAENHKGEKYIKAQVLMSREGAPYVKVNNYKPQAQQPPSFQSQQSFQQPASTYTPVEPSLTPEPSDDIPF